MSETEAAREAVRRELGVQLAEKATERFCLEYLRRQTLGFAEAVAPPAPVVVEFSRVDPRSRERERALFDRSLREVASLRGVVQEAMGDEMRGGATMLAARSVAIQQRRERFLRMAGPVRAELEQTGARLRARGSEAARSPSHTEVCWLNHTLRVATDPGALAEVAADPHLESIDLARRLTPDLDVSTHSIGAVAFRERTGLTGRGVVVAVIDSEVFEHHPALAGRVVHQANFTQEAFGTPGRHGTAVAGIIASNHPTFTGVAPDATIYSYKVLSPLPILSADDFFGSLAIQRALEDGAQVANCSWGAGPAGDGSSREALACDAAWELGLTVVKSAGNGGPGAGTLTTPADADGVIVVGATDRQGTAVQAYSSRGPTTDGRVRPHLVAPGGSAIDGMQSCTLTGGFGDVGHGTSYAAPHVSGLAALLLEHDPMLPPEEVRGLLEKYCRPFSAVDSNTQGAGLVDAASV